MINLIYLGSGEVSCFSPTGREIAGRMLEYCSVSGKQSNMKQGSLGLVFPSVSRLSLSSPGKETPKFWGCTRGSLLLACIPCNNGGCLRDESLLSAAARRVLFQCFFQLPSLNFIHQGGDCIWEQYPPLPPALCYSSLRQDQALEVGG